MSNVTTVIFSKNRAMQLDALIRSLREYAPELGQDIVVIAAISPEHEKAYRNLEQEHSVIVLRESERYPLFEERTRWVIDHCPTPLIAFFVDDDLMFRKPEWNGEIPDLADGYSLRLGLNTTWCYMLKRPQTTTQHDFIYPFSLDGAIYRTKGLSPAIDLFSFDNPNRLEARMVELCENRPGSWSYGEESSVVGIPHNAVSYSANPQHMGGSSAALNLLYLAGYRIDYHAMDFANVIGCHQEIEFKYMKTPNAKPVFSILHPTARLPEGWKPAFDQAMRNCDHPEMVEYILCVDDRDIAKMNLSTPDRTRETLAMAFGGVPIKLVINRDRPCSVAAYNAAARYAEGVMWINAQDDVFFPPHWDTELLKACDPAIQKLGYLGEAVIHVSSGSPRDNELMAPQIYTQARYERYGYVFHPEYLGMYADDEFTERAYADGVVIQARHLLFEQRHPAFGKAPMDAVYEHENSKESYRIGKEIIERRRAGLGFSKASIPGIAPGANAPSGKRTIAWCLPGETYSKLWVAHSFGLFAAMLQQYNSVPIFGYSSNVYVTRQTLAYEIRHLKTKPDFILWMDDDNLVQWPQVEMLIQDLDAHPELDVIAGWCFIQPDGIRIQDRISVGMLEPDGRCIAWSSANLNGDGLNAIEWTGFPIVLMRLSALEKVEFERGFIPVVSDVFKNGFSGEDTSYAIWAKKAGVQMAVDPRVRVVHLKLGDAAPLQAQEVAVRSAP